MGEEKDKRRKGGVLALQLSVPVGGGGGEEFKGEG